MTCILAIKNSKGIVLAGDRMVSNYYCKDILASPKIGKIEANNETLLWGASGNPHLVNILTHKFNLPYRTDSMSDQSYIFEIVDKFMKTVPTYNASVQNKNQTSTESRVIFVYKNSVIVVQAEGSYYESKAGITAVGSGEVPALSVLHYAKDIATEDQWEDLEYLSKLAEDTIISVSKVSTTVSCEGDVMLHVF